MHLPLRLLALASAVPALADFVGPRYPAPKDLSSDASLVASAWKDLSSTLQGIVGGEDSNASSTIAAAAANITFSLGMFSLHDADATSLQFHYTSPEIANAANGTHEVGSDSIYRIASISKLFTVFAGLREIKASDWDRPIAEVVPAIAEFISQASGKSSPAYTIQWEAVTLNAIAAQIAGLPREGYPSPSELMLLAALDPSRDLTRLGLPPIDPSNTIAHPPCEAYLLAGQECPDDLYVESVQARPPTFLPWTTPGYTDNGFALIGLALKNLTGKSLEAVFQESTFDPLGMSSTSVATPPESEWHRSVIPGDAAETFAIEAGIYVTSGGLLSTTSDLARFGNGILNSTLLPADQTRRWMKPVAFTPHLQHAVGRPWEIMRYIHPSGVVTDLYTKSGDSGAYSSFLVLLPDYDAGFSILAASTEAARTSVAALLNDLITTTMLPALTAQAAAEAKANFAGTYQSADPGLNSSLVLTADQGELDAPGLVVESWISNGTDVVAILESSFGAAPWRLLPSISDAKGGKQAFRLVTASDAPSPGAPATQALFSGNGYLGADWIALDSLAYGGVGLSLFVFDVSDGKAVAATPVAFGAALERSD